MIIIASVLLFLIHIHKGFEMDITTTGPDCTVYLETFANNSADFSYCAIQNSRPIEICASCISSYVNLQNSFNNITIQSDDNGPCREQYLDLDRLQIVRSQYSYNEDLWNRAQCSSCFIFVNGSITDNMTEDTIGYRELYNDTHNCIYSKLNNTNYPDICNDCMVGYLELNHFYEKIKRQSNDVICMDVVDLMNKTRKLWSGVLNCCKLRQHPEVGFLVSTTIISLIPIVFYILTKYFTNEMQPSVYSQSRFAESFNAPSTSESR